MAAQRERVLAQLRRADRHGRLGVFHPVHGRVAIQVHAKVLVVDDRLVRVGSANLNQRSMVLDTECDLAIEADSAPDRASISHFRNSLLAEHLGVGSKAVAEAIEAHRGVLAAIASIREQGGRRTLVAPRTGRVEQTGRASLRT
jgi:phospholipase D1/2